MLVLCSTSIAGLRTGHLPKSLDKRASICISKDEQQPGTDNAIADKHQDSRCKQGQQRHWCLIAVSINLPDGFSYHVVLRCTYNSRRAPTTSTSKDSVYQDTSLLARSNSMANITQCQTDLVSQHIPTSTARTLTTWDLDCPLLAGHTSSSVRANNCILAVMHAQEPTFTCPVSHIDRTSYLRVALVTALRINIH